MGHGHSNHILKMIKKLDANYPKIRVTTKNVNINLILKLYSQAVELEYRSLKKEKVLGLLQSASHNFSKPEDFEKVSSNKFLEQINKELLLSESFSFAPQVFLNLQSKLFRNIPLPLIQPNWKYSI